MTRFDSFVNGAGASTRLSRSSLGDDKVVDQSPADLLAQARKVMGDGFDLETYTLARVIKSELGSGTVAELACIGAADVNRARQSGKTILSHATGGTNRYGNQGTPRPVSTARDPDVRHGRVAILLLQSGNELRSLAGGATHYFDPKTQLALWERGSAVHPTVVLERWVYNKPWRERSRDDKGRQVATLGPAGSKSGQKVWVGSITDVDAWELMLFRPLRVTGDSRDDEEEVSLQRRRYEQALELIQSRGAVQPLVDDDELGKRGVFALACAAGAVGVLGAIK